MGPVLPLTAGFAPESRAGAPRCIRHWDPVLNAQSFPSFPLGSTRANKRPVDAAPLWPAQKVSAGLRGQQRPFCHTELEKAGRSVAQVLYRLRGFAIT